MAGIRVIKVTASNYEAENKLSGLFIARLQKIVDQGGSVISIVRDGVRVKKAYVITV